VADRDKIYEGLANDSTNVIGERGAVKAFRLPGVDVFDGQDGVIIIAEDLWESRAIVLLTLDEARTYRTILDHAIGDE